jgi:hypothetical protein
MQTMGTEAPTTIVIPVHCAPKKAPCPKCGIRGRRKRTVDRTVRTVAYKAIALLEITYGEYEARCACCTTFRNTPEGVRPKAHYDNKVRDLVLERLLKDGMSIERALESIRREFLLELSSGFVYDVLRDQAAALDMAAHRRQVLEHFSGTLCVDELHLGRFTLLLATDPLSDLPVAFALVGAHDQGPMQRFLKNLKTWGWMPRVVVTDGSNLYTIVALVLPPLCITMGVYSTGDSSPVFSVVPRGIDGLSPRCSGLPFPALEGLADAIPYATASGTSTI